MSEQEQWRKIPEIAVSYEASNLGRIRRAVADRGATVGKVLQPYVSPKTGYAMITIRPLPTWRKCQPVHRLVALAWLGEPPTWKHVVIHIDDNPANNRPENLQWVTRSEMTNRSIRIHGQSARRSRKQQG